MELRPEPLAGLLPLPYLDRDRMSDRNIADFRRIDAEGHVVYVRKLDDGTYEMVDGGKKIA